MPLDHNMMDVLSGVCSAKALIDSFDGDEVAAQTAISLALMMLLSTVDEEERQVTVERYAAYLLNCPSWPAYEVLANANFKPDVASDCPGKGK